MLRGDFATWTHCQAVNTRPLCAHTQAPSPGSSPAAEFMSPDAPVLQLGLLSPHLPSLQCQALARLLPLPSPLGHSLGALLGHSSGCHPKAEAQGSQPVLSGQSPVLLQAEGSLAPRWHLLVTVQQKDRAPRPT